MKSYRANLILLRHPGRAQRDPGPSANTPLHDPWVPARARFARLAGMTALLSIPNAVKAVPQIGERVAILRVRECGKPAEAQQIAIDGERVGVFDLVERARHIAGAFRAPERHLERQSREPPRGRERDGAGDAHPLLVE